MLNKETFKQFIIFGSIGGGGLIVNMLLYTFFIKTFLTGRELVANVLATTLTILFNWFLNRILTFKSSKSMHTEVLQFFIVSSLALPLNAISLYFMRDLLGYKSIFTDNISIIIATIIGMVLKFVLYKVWVFKIKD